VRKYKRWSNFEIDFLKKNNMKDRLFLINKLERGWRSIRTKIVELGLEYKPYRIYNLDTCFFEKPNIENSYWAGFIAADGYIRKDGKTLEISISEKDSDLLLSFKKSIKYDGFIKKRKIKKGSDQVRLLIKCRKIIDDLKNNFNIVNNKSLILKPPNIEGINTLSYIKGYCDGDGSIKLNSRGKVAIDFNGTKNLLEWIRHIFKEINPNKIGKGLIHKQKSIYRWSLYGKNAEYFGNILKSTDTYHLKRKWEKIKTKKIHNVKDFTRGWILGAFLPSLFINNKFEVGIQRYKAEDIEARHIHKVAVEISVIVSGEVEMDGIRYKEDDIIYLEPGDSTDFKAITDAIITVVKIPSVIGDKYLDG